MITGVLKFLLHHIHSLTKEYEKILNNQEPPIDYPIKNANKKVFAQVNFQPKQIKNMLIKYQIIMERSGDITTSVWIFFMDSGLRWSAQVDSLCDSSNFAISRVRNLFPYETFKNIYCYLVYSFLSYNVLPWRTSSDAGRAFSLQKRWVM